MPRPLHLRGGEVHPIRIEGVPLGLLEHNEYQEMTMTLEKGDVLAFFSDGVSEATDPKEEDDFGIQRVEEILRDNATRPAREIVDAVFTKLGEFEGGHPRRDDQTLVIVRVR